MLMLAGAVAAPLCEARAALSKHLSVALRTRLCAATARRAAKRLQDWRVFIREIHRGS
jgi:hypothetical protein